MSSLLQEIRISVRALAAKPGFTLIAVMTLALGIGANTAIFSIVNTLMFKPLPARDAHELVAITAGTSSAALSRNLSFPEMEDYRSLEVFDGAVANFLGSGPALIDERPETVRYSVVTGNFFEMLGIGAHLGRVFSTQEGRLGGEPVVLISHAYWLSRFAADPAVVGRTFELRGQPLTIVGVTPPEFHGSNLLESPDLYVPISAWALTTPTAGVFLQNREAGGWRVIARLAPGVSFDQAEAAVAVRAAQVAEQYPESNRGVRGLLHPEPLTRLEPGAAVFLPVVASVFMTVVGLVLLVACANVSNLLLARISGKHREMALRAALGAGRLRILRGLVIEAVLLSLAGAAAGLALARWATSLIEAIQVPGVPFFIDFAIDYRVFGFAVLAALACGLAAALIPGFQASRVNLIDALRGEGRSTGGGARTRVRSMLVAAQVGVSLALLVGTGLFIQTLRNVESMDLGFQFTQRLFVTLDTSLNDYPAEQRTAFFGSLLERARQLPGVRSATLSRSIPIGFDGMASQIVPLGEERGPGERIFSMYNAVSSDYFRTLEIPLLEGRVIEETDVLDARRVVVVNQRLANMFWPDGDAIGRLLRVDGYGDEGFEVVGIARDGTYALPGEPPMAFFYLPISLLNPARQFLQIHTRGDPLALAEGVRQEVARLDPQMPISDLRSGLAYIREGKATLLFKLGSSLIGAFGGIGLLLATFGLYGMISFSIQQRQKELGVRMALGATPGGILGLILGQGLKLGIAGIALGLPLALLVSNLLSNFLIGVSATDPRTYLGVTLLVLAIALVASLIPARVRALTVNPVRALKAE